MTVKELAEYLNAEVLTLPAPDRTPHGAYCADLLSWVMGHAETDNVWVTIMTNKNVLAVASLLDVACVVLSESAETDEEFLMTASEKEINVLRSADTSYAVCAKLSRLPECSL